MTNPFDENGDDNPFDAYQEPVAPAYQPPAAAPSNPFEAPSYEPPMAAAPPAAPQPSPPFAPSATPSFSAPAPKPSFPPTAGNGEFVDPITKVKITDKDLDKREAILLEQEQKLSSIEQQIASGTYQKPKQDRNFPPFFKWWSWHPERDLPEDSIKLVKMIRWIYIGTCLVYLVNCIACFCTLSKSAAEHTSSPATKIVLSLLFFVVFCPISFEISFFVLYKALMNGKALRFFCFLGTYIIWFGILAFNIIGIDDGGSLGIIQMINVFSGSSVVGIIGLIFCILGCLDGAAMVWTFILLVRYYKVNGLDKKAFKEGSVMAAGYASDHKEEIAGFAANNKTEIAGFAANHKEDIAYAAGNNNF